MNIAISGFNNDINFIKMLEKNNFIVKDTSDNVELLITRDDLDDIKYKSAKIKRAITNNIRILSFYEFITIYSFKNY